MARDRLHLRRLGCRVAHAGERVGQRGGDPRLEACRLARFRWHCDRGRGHDGPADHDGGPSRHVRALADPAFKPQDGASPPSQSRRTCATPLAAPAEQLARRARARMPVPLRLLSGSHPGGLQSDPGPLPTAMRPRGDPSTRQRRADRLPAAVPAVDEHAAFRCRREPLPVAVPAALHRCARLSDDRVPRRPAHAAASLPGMQRQ